MRIYLRNLQPSTEVVGKEGVDMDIPDFITGSPLFFEMHTAEIMQIIEHCRVINYEPGDCILNIGDRGQSLFVITLGEAVIERSRNNKDIVVQTVTTGDVFGEVALMAQKLRQASVIAKTQTTVLEISYDTIFGLYQKKPKIFGILILNIARLIGKRLSGAYDHIADLETLMILKGYKKAG